MACRGLQFLRYSTNISGILRRNIKCSSVALPNERLDKKPNTYKTEKNLTYLEDPDTFGTLFGRIKTQNETLDDEGDVKEHQYLENSNVQSQNLTIKQYADLIKQYLKHKRLKEAIDVLEVRMLMQDRVKPENYIYNILIGACADVGYTKKAFKLFNEMKRRALKPTGDTYTCLFHACANSPWSTDGLKNAEHLRALMMEKGVEPNLTNYNAMIKAFGRCGDLTTAFKIVDEMIVKKIKIRVHTFNHLLHACIADKNTGLRHAIIVWRKMLKMKEKPNIYTFNLMLRCVKECNLGDQNNIEELISIIQEQMLLNVNRKHNKILSIDSPQTSSIVKIKDEIKENKLRNSKLEDSEIIDDKTLLDRNEGIINQVPNKEHNEIALTNNLSSVSFQLIDNFKDSAHQIKIEHEIVPNLLSKVINMQSVLSLQEVNKPQDKFAIVGGQDEFFKEMKAYSVKPDIKTFTQMLPLIEDNTEAENKFVDTMKLYEIKADIDFYNILIKKRCLRSDYNEAFEVKKMIKMESEYRKKRYPHNKKLRLNNNIMTYGVLAMACQTKESAEQLLNEMKEQQLKVNIEILGSLLRSGTIRNHVEYVLYIMSVVKQENLKVNDVFIKHLETFNDKCASIITQNEKGKFKGSLGLLSGAKKFISAYNNLLKEANIAEVLASDHPWKQFQENVPDTVQRDNIQIVEPKKFYKRKRKYTPYTPRL